MSVGLILLLIIFFIAFTLILSINSTIITEFYTLWIVFVAIVAIMIVVVVVLEKTPAEPTPPVPPTPIVPKTWVTGFINNTNSTNNPLSVISKNSNTYTYGYSQGTIDESIMNFFNGTRTDDLGNSLELENNSTSTNKYTNYITKHNNEGILQWVAKIENVFVQSGNGGNFITSDSEENIYLIGNFNLSNNNIIFYNSISVNGETPTFGANLETTLPSTFIAKYNKNGIYQWSTYITGSLNLAKGIDCDINDDLHIIFDTRATTTFYSTDSSTPVQVSLGGSGYTVYTKYNKDGVYQYFNMIGGNIGTNGSISKSFCIKNFENNTYIIGTCTGASVNFYNKNNIDSILNIPIGPGNNNNDTFIVKYTNGDCIRATKITQIAIDIGTSISIDKDENVYICGFTSSSSINIFDPSIVDGSSGTLLWTMNETTDLGFFQFIVKYDNNLLPQWSSKIEGIGNEFGLFNINATSEGNNVIFYTSGNFNGANNINFYNTINTTGSGELIKSINTNFIPGNFVTKYDSDGNLIFTVANTGYSNNIFSNENYFYNAGIFNSSIDIYQTTSETEPILSYTLDAEQTVSQGYLLKYDKNGVIIS